MGQPVTITPDQPSSAAVTITPDASAPAGSFMGRVADRISQNVAGLPDLPGKIADDPKGAALGAIDSMTSVATPGLISRWMHHDDPANIVGDTSAALGTQMLGGEGPRPARGSVAAAMQPAESTGRLGRLVDVAKSEVHVPVLGRVVKYWNAWKGPDPPAPPTPAPPALGSDAGAVPSGWPSPSPEIVRAKGLMEGGKTPADPAAGLGRIPVHGSIAESMAAAQSPIAETPAAQQSAAPPPAPTAQAAPRPVSKGQLGKSMDEQLGRALGAKPLNPKLPLRSQMPGRMPTESEAALAEGHTAVESSALKSYRYDPSAQEFHAQYNSGNKVHIFGDVSPEEAQAFEAAPSKGKAMALISKHPEVARIIDGKRVTVPRRGVTSAP